MYMYMYPGENFHSQSRLERGATAITRYFRGNKRRLTQLITVQGGTTVVRGIRTCIMILSAACVCTVVRGS